VQGVALRVDEFGDERFAGSGLVHLAMPGRIDLSVPDRSRLLLSGARENPESEFLAANRLRRFGLQARLAVLSQTVIDGTARSEFDSRIGLVSDLQDAGAERVLVTLRPLGDREAASLMADYYQSLLGGHDPVSALDRVRKALIDTKNPAKLATWGGIQLFIR
jgi:CHAT domain-containing protein